MEEASPRLVDQRIRNRIVEVVSDLCKGNSHVDVVGANEWFNSFFDWFPLDDQQSIENSAMTADELQAVSALRQMMVQSSCQIPRMITAEQLQDTGWPERIRPHAKELLELMRRRGRFSEDVEEAEPSSPIP